MTLPRRSAIFVRKVNDFMQPQGSLSTLLAQACLSRAQFWTGASRVKSVNLDRRPVLPGGLIWRSHHYGITDAVAPSSGFSPTLAASLPTTCPSRECTIRPLITT